MQLNPAERVSLHPDGSSEILSLLPTHYWIEVGAKMKKRTEIVYGIDKTHKVGSCGCWCSSAAWALWDRYRSSSPCSRSMTFWALANAVMTLMWTM